MQVVKYFYEEPVALEVLSGDDDPDARRRYGSISLEDFLDAPRYARGYLAASDLETGRIAASVLPESIASLMDDVLPRPRVHYMSGVAGLSVESAGGREGLRDALTDQSRRSVLVCGPSASPESARVRSCIGEIIERDLREALGAVTELLERGLTLLISEPSHDGHDWAVFSPEPLSADVRASMAKNLDDVIGYVIPYARARAEHRFYFEQVDPEVYREYRVAG